MDMDIEKATILKFYIGCFRVLWCGDRGPELAGASEQERKVPHGLMV